MKEIQLNKGFVVKVDDEDFEYLTQWRWRVSKGDKREVLWYAVRKGRLAKVKSNNLIVNEPNVIYMHKEILKRMGHLGEGDHVNTDGLDNQRLNLRKCTHVQNCRNKRRSPSTSNPYKGVSWDSESRKWRAKICIANRRSTCLGRFLDPVDAAYRYDRAAIKYFGEFARLNFPGGMG